MLPNLESKDAFSSNILFDNALMNEQRHTYYDTQIESMEGATFQKICEEYETPYLQIRAVSNFVGERNKANWKINDALKKLGETVTPYLEQIL